MTHQIFISDPQRRSPILSKQSSSSSHFSDAVSRRTSITSSPDMTHRIVLRTNSGRLRRQPFLSNQSSSASSLMMSSRHTQTSSAADVSHQITVGTKPESVHQRQSLQLKKSQSNSQTMSCNFAEVAGGTTAECAVVVCCCPCTVVDLLVLAVVKLPAGLCRRALRKKVHKRRIGLLQPKRFEDEDMYVGMCVTAGTWPEKSPATAVSEMEEEMWNTFFNTGFWRSPSAREN
ncbi:uncharacterized protein LOC131250149 [Magnolia sinica]|uniref:uncharacterized protein LOC131250149 n=1 Tax=Magnolia sinica TaxID=86752 RepID=UPI00265B1B1E|nr:uncharacterized protein LOC131250149 [Magnolia sinica]